MTRVAVVTGAAGGIGSATCDLLVERGWEVVAVDRRPTGRPGEIQLDLTDAGALASALSALPRVDGLVNNAAQQLFKPLKDTTVEEWDDLAAANLRAAFVCVQAVHDQLVAAGGAVVNVGSVHARATSASISAYAASKGGLSAFTRAAAIELAPLGIRVNAVLPGAIDTPALRDGFSRRDDAEASLVASTPLRRIGLPLEVAEAIGFFLEPATSSFVTGQELVVDGGVLARLASE